jgi:hypothetical protein
VRIYALPFADGVSAADFIVALRAALSAESAAPAHAASPPRAWIDSPLRARGKELCCVYLTESSLDAAYTAGLDVPEPETVDDPTFPDGRILVLDLVPAG